MEIDKKENYTVDVEKFGPQTSRVVATQFADFDDRFDKDKYGQTERRLQSRHVALMIIGQSIGTGLFIGLATPLQTSGSLSLLLGFLWWSCLCVWPLMQCVAEMCSYLPIKGTFIHFAARWVDPALGFASSIIYIYTSMMFVCLEATAVASVCSYWTDINPAMMISVSLALFFVFNVFGVNWYGEVEFVSLMLKVLLIVGLMFFGLVSMCGGNPNRDAYGFQHWKEGGLMRLYLVGGSTGRFLGLWNVLIYAAFACGGPDLLAVISGEVTHPRKVIPLAGRRAYIRIYLFYFGGIFFMNTLCASNNEALVAASAAGKAGAAASPWVIGIQLVGVHGVSDLVNAVIMTAAWSCGNGFVYGAIRSTYSASLAGYLPRFFSKCLKNGAPIYCVILTVAVGGLAYLSVSKSTATVFNWFVNLATTGLLCTYLVIWACYFQFRRALDAQGLSYKDDMYFHAPRFVHPMMTYFGVGFNVVVLFFNGFWIFFPGQFSVANLFTSYFAPVFMAVLYVGWKFAKGTHIRTALEADITTGKAEIDEEEQLEYEEDQKNPRKTGFLYRVWYAVADFCFN